MQTNEEFLKLAVCLKPTKKLNESYNAKKLLNEVDKKHYVVREEMWDSPFSGQPMKMTSAYSKQDNSYIGTPDIASYLVNKIGITEFWKAQPEHSVTSTGFNPAQQKWYGWSHRALCGFGVGDKIYDEKFAGARMDTPFIEHGTVTIESMDQARLSAQNFARSVS